MGWSKVRRRAHLTLVASFTSSALVGDAFQASAGLRQTRRFAAACGRYPNETRPENLKVRHVGRGMIPHMESRNLKSSYDNCTYVGPTSLMKALEPYNMREPRSTLSAPHEHSTGGRPQIGCSRVSLSQNQLHQPESQEAIRCAFWYYTSSPYSRLFTGRTGLL
ncbi:hypothetical protein BD414DRAFT_490304 [Trametes punicea]|nr:hypothetical protein BD414DRAFT_490304 [Trametes punicea]